MTRLMVIAMVLVTLLFGFEYFKTDALAGNAVSIAKTYQGNSETKNSGPLVKLFRDTFRRKINPRKTPWCAAFVNGVLHKAGVKGTNSLSARSFVSWGSRVKNPQNGDVVLIRRRGGSGYHVGFYVGRKGNKVLVLGGNQSNRVKVSAFSINKVAQYRRG